MQLSRKVSRRQQRRNDQKVWHSNLRILTQQYSCNFKVPEERDRTMWIIYEKDIPSTMFSHHRVFSLVVCLTNNYHFDLAEQSEFVIYLVTKCQTSGPRTSLAKDSNHKILQISLLVLLT